MVQETVDYGLPFEVVIFDSWYFRRPLVDAVEGEGKDWIGGCPDNRKVLLNGRWMQMQDFIPAIPADAYRPYRIGGGLYWAFTKVMPMQCLDRRRVCIVASYRDAVNLSKLPRFYTTNRKEWEPKRIRFD